MLRALLNALFIAAIALQASALGASKPTCGGTSSLKNIKLQAPKKPPRECVYHIKAYSSYVCQLRIDFSMRLAQPTLPTAENGLRNAQCLDDYFDVGGLHLCGTESNQHVYIPFNRTAGVKKIDLRIVLAARVGRPPLPKATWDIHVTQLECPAGAAIRNAAKTLQPEARASIKDGFFVAPPGCLQYFPQSFGAFASFNFNEGLGTYPGDLNYAICFRRTERTKTLELHSHFFKLGALTNSTNQLALDDLCYPQQRSEGNSEDFLMIPQATLQEHGIRATYFCGDSAANAVIKSTHPGPLMVIFNSYGVYRSNATGFVFSYKLL